MVKDFGKVTYTLLYLKWITNRDLLYSTRNSAQHYVPAWMGRESGENGYMCMYVSQFCHCLPETTTALLVSLPQYTMLPVFNKKVTQVHKSICQERKWVLSVLIEWDRAVGPHGI